jgi:uncharacterized membrane protein YgcG
MAQTKVTGTNPWLIEVDRRRRLQIASWLMQRAFWAAGIVLAVLIGTLLWQNRTDFTTGSSKVTIDRHNIFVSDNAHLLGAATKTQIKRANQAFAKMPDKPQLLVVTVDRLPAGESIEEFTIRLASKLGVGDAAADSGIVYLLAKREHQARLEVGYGMESTIPDGFTDIITDGKVKDYYRKGNYDAGISLVARRITSLVRTGDFEDGAAAASTDLSWRGTWVWLTSTVIGQIVLILAWCVLLFFCYKLVYAGRRLWARLLVDQLWRHYAADMQGAGLGITTAAALALKPSAAIKEARKPFWQRRHDEELAHPEGRLARRPDYYDMNFAFGIVTPENVVANAESLQEKFKTTSVYLHNWRAWYANRGCGGKLYSTPPELLADRDRQLIRPNLLTTVQRLAYQVISFGLLHWLILSIAGYCVWVFRQTFWFESLWARLMQTFETVVRNAFNIFNMLNAAHGVLYAFSTLVAVVCLWLGSMRWTSYGALLRQRVRLDDMMRRYMADLRKNDQRLAKDEELAAELDAHNGDDALTHAKRAVASANNHKNKKRADYTDMAFAMGSITNASFLISGLNHAAIKSSSMVNSHQDDWYRPSGGSGSGGSSGDSGGGDSFGGGGFGGGGGTSSW